VSREEFGVTIKNAIQWKLRTVGIELSGYRHTVRARRQQIFSRYGVELLVDVGANRGQYASEARKAGYRGRLISMEPLGTAFADLSRAAATDPLWETLRVAVGKATGSVTLNVSEADIFSSILPVTDSALSADPQSRRLRTEEVPLARLDDLIDETNVPTAVKIDVQGSEREVIDGGMRLLADSKVVEIELSPTPIYAGQMLLGETMDRLNQLGLVLSLVENLLPDKSTGRALQFNGIFVRAG
jgi:FkbM family methyltransferase